MPIPTRSKSLKDSTTQGKSFNSQGPAQQRDVIPVASVSASTGPQARESRLPGPGRSIPIHTRSQSSYMAIPRPTGTGETTQGASRSNASTAAAHTRSRSVVAAAVPTSSQGHKLQPTQSLLRAPSQVTKPTSRPGFVARSQQHTQTTRKVGEVPVTVPREHVNASSAAPSLPKSQFELPSRIKDELIQLAVAHNNSPATLHSLELSIEQKIESSSSAIRAEVALVRGLEQERQADVNAEALQDWLSESEGLHDLSFCLSEILDLNSSRGLYTACMKQFEDWLYQAEQAHQHHKDATDTFLVDPIDRIWESNISRVAERLEVCDHILQRLQHTGPHERSALTWANMQLRALTASMRQAVAESQSIHGTVLTAQRQWIDVAVAELVAEQGKTEEVSHRIGLWN